MGTHSRQSERFNALQIKKLSGTVGRHHDGRGLYLAVSSPTAASWMLRYELGGRAHWMGLGPYPEITLAEAREKVLEARRLKVHGKDPLQEKRSQRAALEAEKAKAVTFGQALQDYVKAHGRTWSTELSRQWHSGMRDFALPMLGARLVSGIETADVLAVLKPRWETKTETMDRLRRRIEAVLDFAKVAGLRHGDNPARWSGHLDQLLPARTKIAPVKGHPALPYRDVPAFMIELRQLGTPTAHALAFTILTAARAGETRGATWQEIDLANGVWIVPAERMKKRREHRVPLTGEMIELLGTPGNGADPIFEVSRNASQYLLAKLRPGFVVHGFRSSFRVWAGEVAHEPELAEHALAHVVGGTTERAYSRTDLLERRRPLMAAWSRFCYGEGDR